MRLEVSGEGKSNRESKRGERKSGERTSTNPFFNSHERIQNSLWLIDSPPFFSHTQTHANTTMPQSKTIGTLDPAISEELAARRDMETKREMAGRLLKGDGVDKAEEKAVSLLDDCVAHGDADAMVMLAKCCARGCGMEHDAERAEVLLSDAAEKGNDEARILMKLISDWKGKEILQLCGL